MPIQRVIALISLTLSVSCQDPCGTGRVQSIVDSFITTCMQEEASQIDWRGNCSSLETSAWQRGCEWGNRYAAVYLMNSLLPDCDATPPAEPFTVNTSMSGLPQDICTHSAADLKNCIATNNITTTSPIPKSSSISCSCLETHRTAILECPFLLGISNEVAPVGSYYSFSDIRNKCSPSCDLDSISVDETNNTDVFALTVSLSGEKPQEAFRTVISSSVGFEVSPSQIYILYWEGVEGEDDTRFVVNFFLMNVLVSRVTAVVDSLNKTIADPNSILRQQLDADPHFLTEANTPEPPPSPPFILKDEETPASMIAVTVVLGVLLFIAIVGYALSMMMDSDDGETEHDAKEESEEGEDGEEDETPNGG